MSDRIFIHVYLDEDMDVLVASLLRSRGFEATTARQAGQMGKTDAEQLEHAVCQRAAILTHNRTDFEALAREYFEQERAHPLSAKITYVIQANNRREAYDDPDRTVSQERT